MKNCDNCQFCEFDYIFDEKTGDEYQIVICEKGNDVSLDYECEDFKEYKAEKYMEKDTECDKCKYLSKCIENRNVVNSRTIMDIEYHYVVGREGCCKKLFYE